MENSELMYKIVKDKDAYYSSYNIKKKNGELRLIENPKDELKTIQRELLDRMLRHIKIDKNVHGFVENRGIYTNVALHVGAVCVVHLDLKDFFHTVTKEKIIKELGRFVRTPNAIAELATYKERLPQGSPTSPCISNIVCVRMDRKLGGLAKRFNAVYTRYADDITFSSKTNKDLHKIIPKAHSFIKGEGFELNYKKTRVMRKGCRQIVTGLTVNSKVNVPRARVRNFRAELHQTHLSGTKDDYLTIQQLKGFNAFIMGANKNKGIKFAEKIDKMVKDVA